MQWQHFLALLPLQGVGLIVTTLLLCENDQREVYDEVYDSIDSESKLFDNKYIATPTKPPDSLSIVHSIQLAQKMPYLIQPPAHSIDTCNQPFTYTLADPTPSELSKIKDLQKWGWQVSLHSQDDEKCLAATKGIEKAIKKKRRRTQMVYGDMMGDGSRPTFEEVWEQESIKRSTQRLFETEAKEMDISDQATIMSHMTQQKIWLHWADEEAEGI